MIDNAVWCVFAIDGLVRIFSSEEKAYAWTVDQWKNNPDQLTDSERTFLVRAIEVH